MIFCFYNLPELQGKKKKANVSGTSSCVLKEGDHKSSGETVNQVTFCLQLQDTAGRKKE